MKDILKCYKRFQFQIYFVYFNFVHQRILKENVSHFIQNINCIQH